MGKRNDVLILNGCDGLTCEICSTLLPLIIVPVLVFFCHLNRVGNFSQNYEFFISACFGRFGKNCNQSCPHGYYGRGCRETCSCNISLCDNVLGCSEVESGKWV